eukprot:TRINITY_DN1937_c0_g1_i3.p1 TRINITY_DN1937_c0_g1~~TRINITY_DN1937_c0_g1_i3.p1  ORF type:complete len:114 (-),score=14.02 TRINITY_DN1937_c0_g1_i3:108-449(-)
MDYRLVLLLLSAIPANTLEHCKGGEFPEDNCIRGRLLADSGNWAVGVILIGIVGMLAFLGFVGYMVFLWKFSDDTTSYPPAAPSSAPTSNPGPSTGSPADPVDLGPPGPNIVN